MRPPEALLIRGVDAGIDPAARRRDAGFQDARAGIFVFIFKLSIRRRPDRDRSARCVSCPEPQPRIGQGVVTRRVVPERVVPERAVTKRAAARPAATPDSRPVVLTVGHSTRTLAEFLALLAGHAVTRLVDVRTVPRSRHNPQFNRDTLPAALEAAGIAYEHVPGLGGLRRTHADSPNGGWRNTSFRGYADHMQTPAFSRDLDALIERAAHDRIVLMCAEAVPWRCHRSLIADALMVHGVRAEEIVSATRVQAHRMTPFVRVEGALITYPPAASP